MRKNLPGIISLFSLFILVFIQIYVIYGYYTVKSSHFDLVYSRAVLNTINSIDFNSGEKLDILFNEAASRFIPIDDKIINPQIRNEVLQIFDSLLKKYDTNSFKIKEYLLQNKLDTSFQSFYRIKEISFLDFNYRIPVYKDTGKFGSLQKAKGLYIKSYDKEGNFYNVQYEFYIDFTHKRMVIIAEMKGLLVMVILTIVAVILTFLYTLKTLHRQKKLTELKDDFIDNITHEFKTPLSVISVAISSLKQNRLRNDTQKFEETCNILEKQNLFLSKMIENVIDVSLLDRKKNTYNTKQVLLKIFVSEIVDSFLTTDASGKDVQITQEYLVPDNYKYALDPVQFTRVIVNLLKNSVKYCVHRPDIKLRVSVANSLRIEMEDNGIGIKEEHLKKVFNKFYRAENPDKVKGLGLGLYIVKRIIENHNGTIHISSTPGNGTTVTILLPI